MSNEPRKATDIILSLERKIDTLNNRLNEQDLLLKIISNKLSVLISTIENSANKKIIVETVSTPPATNVKSQVLVSSEDSLPLETQPKGFRRVSRPETYAGDDAYLPKPSKQKESSSAFPVQIPKSDGKTEIVVPDMALNLNKNSAKEKVPIQQSIPTNNNIPIIQRIVDRNGKSVFLADVEIIDLATIETIAKTRTNGAGKWQASLPIGEYKVVIKKLESLTKQKVEIDQTIRVDGTQSPLELQMMIIK